MTQFDIYLWQQADSVIALIGSLRFFAFTAIVAFILMAILNLCMAADRCEIPADLKRAQKWTLAFILICSAVLFVGSLIPSSKTIAMMVALPAIVNSKPIQKDLPELYKLAKDALKDQLSGK